MKLTYKTTPWEHQRAALRYLYKRDTAALYTDMGTGKTKIMIDLIINRKFQCVLIVCTNKGCAVWERQFQIHSDIHPNFIHNVSGLSTLEKVRILSQSLPQLKHRTLEETHVIIVNYEGVWRPDLAKYLLRKTTGIDCIICDESHRIKSASSKCSRFLALLGKQVSHRYLVTGTPLAENPMDVYAQYRFLDPLIFGTSFSNFKKKYQNIDAHLSARVGFPILDKNNPYKNLDELKEKFFSCAFLAESEIKLPKRLNIVRRFSLCKDAQDAYYELQKEGVLEYEEGALEVNNVLSMSLRKQQLTSGYVSVKDDDGNESFVQVDTGRIETLADLLDGFNKDEPIVIFAKFRRDLKNIQEVCRKIGRGYSELSGRLDTEKDWQDGKTSVLGVQYASGSESVDFTRARYCIYYSLTYSLAQYEQSKKRIHRPGQTRSVVYYYLIANLSKGISIDQVMLNALRHKKGVIQYIMEKGPLT